MRRKKNAEEKKPTSKKLTEEERNAWKMQADTDTALEKRKQQKQRKGKTVQYMKNKEYEEYGYILLVVTKKSIGRYCQ